jgi:hypothetical protein
MFEQAIHLDASFQCLVSQRARTIVSMATPIAKFFMGWFSLKGEQFAPSIIQTPQPPLPFESAPVIPPKTEAPR